MLNEAYISEAQRRTRLGVFLARVRHEGCGGRAAKAEFMTGVVSRSCLPCSSTPGRACGCRLVSKCLCPR
jgi:hypothetical protein